jgi:uncharacterized protein
MRVAEIWRYPVKSLQGERLDAAAATASGIEGDRQFAIYDLETGFGLTARRVPELLFAGARHRDGSAPEITLPDGSLANDDHALSAWLGRPVVLRSADEDVPRRYENVVDFEHEAASEWNAFEGADAAFHDSPAARVSLVSTATIGSWDRRRFRPNVLLDGEGEEALVGASIALGDTSLRIVGRIKRCVMTTRPQPGGIERDLDVLRTIARERDTRLAVAALVARPGTIRVGDVIATGSGRSRSTTPTSTRRPS